MLNRLVIYIIVSCIAILSCSRSETANDIQIRKSGEYQAALERFNYDKSDYRLLISIFRYCSKYKNYDELIDIATPLYYRFRDSDSHKAVAATASTYLAQSYSSKDMYDSVEVYLGRCSEIQESMNRRIPILAEVFHNTSAIYILKTQLDYTLGLEHFKEALSYAVMADDTVGQCAILSNISTIYESRKDTNGFVYIRKALELRNKSDYNDVGKITVLVHLATFYILKNDTENALHYIDQALEIIKDNPGAEVYESYTRLTKAEILSEIHDYDSANTEYDRALSLTENENTRNTIQVYYSYGRSLIRQQRYDAAINCLLKSIELSEEINNEEYKNQALYAIANAYEQKGDTSKAFIYYKDFNNQVGIERNVIKEREFNNLLLRYEQTKHKEETAQKDKELLEKSRNNIIYVFIIIIILISLGYSYILYKKKNKLYKNLVKQYYNTKCLLEKMENDRHCHNRPDDSKIELFNKLEKIMKQDKIFTDPNLSLNTLATMLNTNSTYISNIVNQYSGKSLPNYINSYRINYVIDKLSDINNDEPLKSIFSEAGYISITTAYRSFQKEVGCSPSKYREQFRILHKEG